MRTRGPKKTSTVIITLTITVIIVTALIIGIMMLITKKEPVNIADNNQGSVTQEVATGKFYENGWDSSVVAEIRDGVPVPTGYSYVSGEKETGLIIQNEENGKQYVWIPYDEEVVSDEALLTEEEKSQEINSYFTEKENTSINPDKLAEIQKYGGFYAGIEYLDLGVEDDENTPEEPDTEITTYSIATMSMSEYEAAEEQVAETAGNEVSVNGSVLGKEELSMILNFNENLIMNDEGTQISTSLLGATVSNPFGAAIIGKKVYAKEGTYGYPNVPPLEKPAEGSPYARTKFNAGDPFVVMEVREIRSGLRFTYCFKCKAYDDNIYYVYASDISTSVISSSWTFYMGGLTRYTTVNTGIYKSTSKGSNNLVKSVAIGTRVYLYKKATINGTEWAYIKVGNDYGYIEAKELGTKNIWTSLPTNTIRYTNAAAYVYVSPRTRVRDRTAVTQVAKATEVRVYKKATIDNIEWAYVKANGKTGYMLTSYLTTQKPTTNTTNNSNNNNNNNNNKTSTPSTPNTPSTPTNTNTVTNTTTEEPVVEEEEEQEPPTIPAYTGEVITVKPGDSKLEETTVPDEWKGTVAKIVNGVPIPEGFEVAEYYGTDPETGFVIKQTSSKEAENSHRLCYVWIPVNKDLNSIETLAEAKSALNDIYTKNGANTKTSESATESLPEELVQSIKEYGGFYMAQGELGYDNNAKLYNRPRGMKMYSNGWYGVDMGNYFRYVSPEAQQDTTVNYVAAAASYNGIINGMTLEKINQVCEMLSTDSVTSHLTYGAEWDAAMLWILKQDDESSEDLASLLIKDSSSIGKYSGSLSNIKLLNSVWGLAGNLSEVTQEKVDGKIVVRGGSYTSLGSEQPVASRTAIDESEIEKSTEHGFRNCLYINPSSKSGQGNNTTEEKDSTLKQLIDSEKETTAERTTVEDADGNKITIPQGFKVTKDAYYIEDGVVIENAQGNQFVWIPVKDINEMYNEEAGEGKLYNISKSGSSLKVITNIQNKYFEPGIITGGDGRSFDASEENLKTVEVTTIDRFERQLKNEFDQMINSVKTYGGFYIARYETGEMNQSQTTSKKDSQNRTNISWYTAYVNNKKIVAGNYGIVGMIYGCQWDMALRWLQECDNTNQSLNHIEDLNNGTAEWTMEAYANDARIVREAANANTAVEKAGTRTDYNPTQTNSSIASRAMMYVR